MKDARGTYPGIERYPVSNADDPSTLSVPPEHEFDSVRPQYPPKHHLSSADRLIEESVWDGSETRKTKVRSS